MEAILFDGVTARPRSVTLRADADGIAMSGDTPDEHIAFADLRRDGPLRLRHAGRPDWQVQLSAPLPAEWAGRLRAEGSLDTRGRRRLAVLAGAGVALVAGLWFGGPLLLDAAAPLVPYRVTEPIGEGLVEELGAHCYDARATNALARLAWRLGVDKLPEPVTITIINAPIENAIALPGGQIVLFRKIIADAKSPDELAGVLAHEMSHLEHRHPNKLLL